MRGVLFRGYPEFDIEIEQNSTFDKLGVVSFSATNDQIENISNISIKYYNPSGEEVSNIDTSVLGKWKISYEYEFAKIGNITGRSTVTRNVTVK